MTEKQANMLRNELTNPPKYNIQKQEIDVEAMLNSKPKSNWLVEFEALRFQNEHSPKQEKKWYQFWKR